MKHDEIHHIVKYPAGHFSTLTALTKFCNNSNTPHLFPLIALSFTLFLAKCKIGRQSVNLWSQLSISHRRPTASKCSWVNETNFCPSVLHLQPALISRSLPKNNTWLLWPLPDYLVDQPSLLGHLPVSFRLLRSSGSELSTEFREGFTAALSNQMPPLWHRQMLAQIT